MTRQGTTNQRGYTYAHRAARKRWLPTIQAGNGYCCEEICLMPTRWIPPDTPWDLAHHTDRTLGYRGPAHTKCNRTEGARRGYIAQQASYAMRRIMRTRW